MMVKRKSSLVTPSHRPVAVIKFTWYPRSMVFDANNSWKEGCKARRSTHAFLSDTMGTPTFLAGVKWSINDSPFTPTSILANMSTMTTSTAVRKNLGLNVPMWIQTRVQQDSLGQGKAVAEKNYVILQAPVSSNRTVLWHKQSMTKLSIARRYFALFVQKKGTSLIEMKYENQDLHANDGGQKKSAAFNFEHIIAKIKRFKRGHTLVHRIGKALIT